MPRGLTRRAVAAVGVAVSLGALSISAGAAARADGLHLLPWSWKLGCAINYSVDARGDAEYGPNIAAGLESLHVATGFGFTKLAAGDTRASIRFVIVDELPPGVAGRASSTGRIELLTSSKLGGSWDPSRSSMVRDEIVIHETLHVLGLDHDLDEGAAVSDEIMFTSARWGVLTFGEGDREGMAHVSALNGCVAPDPNAQPVPAVPLSGSSRQPSSSPTPAPTAAPQADAPESPPAAIPPPASPPTSAEPAPAAGPNALEKCLAAEGFRAKGLDHYCPPLKHEVIRRPGRELRTFSARAGSSSSS